MLVVRQLTISALFRTWMSWNWRGMNWRRSTKLFMTTFCFHLRISSLRFQLTTIRSRMLLRTFRLWFRAFIVTVAQLRRLMCVLLRSRVICLRVRLVLRFIRYICTMTLIWFCRRLEVRLSGRLMRCCICCIRFGISLWVSSCQSRRRMWMRMCYWR